MSKPVKKTKAILRIADLQPTVKRITLVHPDESIDLGDAWIDLVAREASTEWMLAVNELQKVDYENLSQVERLALTVNLACVTIKDWDEESFGGPFSVDAARNLLIQSYNMWIYNQINDALDDRSNFFKKA